MQVLSTVDVGQVDHEEEGGEQAREKRQQSEPDDERSPAGEPAEELEVVWQRRPGRDAEIAEERARVDHADADEVPPREVRGADQSLQHRSPFYSHRKEMGKPAGGRELSNGQVGDVEHKGVGDSHWERYAEGVHQADDEDGRNPEPEQGNPIGRGPLVLHSTYVPECGAPDPLQMAPRDPDRPERQQDHCAVALQVEDSTGRSLLSGQSNTEASAVHDSQFENRQQAECPEAEQDIQIAEVGKPDHRGQDAEIDRRKVPAYMHRLGQVESKNGDFGQYDREITHDIPEKDTKYQKKARPEDAIAEEAGYPSRLVESRRQLHGKLRKRIGQPLGILPLALEDNKRADAGCEHGDGDRRTPKEGPDPPDPGHGCLGRKAVVIGPDNSRRRIGHIPPGQGVEERLFPPVLGGGEVGGSGQGTRPVAGKTLKGDVSGDPGHAVDHQEFGAAQRRSGEKGLQAQVDEEPKTKRDQHRHWKLGLIQGKGAHDHAGIVGIDVENYDSGRAQENGAEGDAGGRLLGSLAGLGVKS